MVRTMRTRAREHRTEASGNARVILFLISRDNISSLWYPYPVLELACQVALDKRAAARVGTAGETRVFLLSDINKVSRRSGRPGHEIMNDSDAAAFPPVRDQKNDGGDGATMHASSGASPITQVATKPRRSSRRAPGNANPELPFPILEISRSTSGGGPRTCDKHSEGLSPENRGRG